MFFMVRSKMMNRKGLTACLLLGCLIASAIICSIPLYTDGVLQRLMVRDLEAYEQKWHANPALLTLTHLMDYDVEGGYTAYLEEHETYSENVMKSMQMELWDSSELLVVSGLRFQRQEANNKRFTPVSFYGMSGYENWIQLVAGRLPEPGRQEDGSYEALIQAQAQQDLDLSVGSLYRVRDYTGQLGEGVTLKIVGVFAQSDAANMWDYTAYTDWFFLDYETLRVDFVDRFKKLTEAAWVYSMDYTTLKIDEIDNALDGLDELTQEYCIPYEKTIEFPAGEILNTYRTREKQLRTMLWGLNVPVLMMLGFYLFMVAQLIVQSDAAELSVIASRGGGQRQILELYLYQSLFLCTFALLLGPVLSWGICKMMGAMTGFCDFGHRLALPILLRPRTLVYALAAFGFTLLMLLAPALRAGRQSIVTVKQSRSSRWKAPLWQKLFLDVICIALSLYGLHSYSLRQETLLTTAANGLDVPVDPWLFAISTLFLLGAGLLFIRIWPWIVRLIFRIGHKVWNAPMYSAFTNTTRGGSRERFLMLFLILTFAIGVYSGNTAATLNGNMLSRVRYQMPVDARMSVKWMQPSDPSVMEYGGSGYVETDFNKVINLEGVKSGARVHLRDQMVSRIVSQTVSTVGQKITGTVMVFDPKEFSQVIHAEKGLMQYSIYDYLQLMKDYPTGIVVSSAYAQEYELAIGDTLRYYIKDDEGLVWGETEGQILAFTDYWPGINPSEEKGKFFILSNYNYWKMQNLLMPYEYWLDLEDGVKAADLYAAAEENPYTTITALSLYEEALSAGQNDPLLEGANGALTMGFVMTMTAAITGFLLHWLMSARSRELQFGILRAMGMSAGSLMTMLLVEQALLCLSSVIAGVLIGGIAGKLFIPMMQMVASASEQCPPYQIFARPQDYGRLYGWMALLFGAGLAMLSVLMKRMKVTHALKLGED